MNMMRLLLNKNLIKNNSNFKLVTRFSFSDLINDKEKAEEKVFISKQDSSFLLIKKD
jgi:hypothetical protein